MTSEDSCLTVPLSHPEQKWKPTAVPHRAPSQITNPWKSVQVVPVRKEPVLDSAAIIPWKCEALIPWGTASFGMLIPAEEKLEWHENWKWMKEHGARPLMNAKLFESAPSFTICRNKENQPNIA
ncbi:uncharacterized protein RHO17_026179 [Thomomys bottae]